MTAAAAGKNLGTSGKIFFGSLCAGTFGLGCWQLERLFEKWDAIEDREHQLGLPPMVYSDASNSTETTPYRRRLLQGRFLHDKEVLIGPRGAPHGVQLPVSGLSAKQRNSSSKATTTTTSSGMQPGPQGFYVLTPMEVNLSDDEYSTTAPSTSIVWVNRGWVPKTVVPGADRPYYKNDPLQTAQLQKELQKPPAWTRPKGLVELTAVRSEPEKPRFMTPEHDYSKRPLQLFWIDGLALKALAADKMTPQEQADPSTAMVTQVSVEDSPATPVYPLQPPVTSVGAFKTTPATHVGYAATWFGLSGAGWYMTRKLITKGRY